MVFFNDNKVCTSSHQSQFPLVEKMKWDSFQADPQQYALFIDAADSTDECANQLDSVTMTGFDDHCALHTRTWFVSIQRDSR